MDIMDEVCAHVSGARKSSIGKYDTPNGMVDVGGFVRSPECCVS